MKNLLTIVVFFGVFCTDLIANELKIAEAKVRAPIPGMVNTAGYMQLTNHTNTTWSFVRASSPLADKVEFHDHISKDGVMTMVKLDKITIKPAQTLEFKSGGLHLMFLGVKPEFKADKVQVSLYTAEGKEVSKIFKMVSVHDEHQHHNHHHHH